MKHILISILLILILKNGNSQNYTRDAGIQFGSKFEFSYRQFFKNDVAYEAYLGYSKREIKFTAFKEFFNPAFQRRSSSVEFCYGFGGHIGLTYLNSYDFFLRKYHLDNWSFAPILGIDGMARLDYYFREFPLILTIGIRPYFEFSTYRYFYLDIFEPMIEFKYRF